MTGPTRGYHFERPRCPYCQSGWLRSRHKGYICLTCDTAFPRSQAIYHMRPKPRTRAGSGQIAGPTYYKGLLFPGGRRRYS